MKRRKDEEIIVFTEVKTPREMDAILDLASRIHFGSRTIDTCEIQKAERYRVMRNLWRQIPWVVKGALGVFLLCALTFGLSVFTAAAIEGG